MNELNPLRRDAGAACEPGRTIDVSQGRTTSRFRRLAWELLLLGTLVTVTGVVLERSGMHDSGSAEATTLGEHTGAVRSLAFVGGTSNLVSLDMTGESWLWDTETRRVLSSLGRPMSQVTSQEPGPHGRALVTGGHEGTITRWDLATGGRQALFASAQGPILALAVAGDGRTIAVSDLDSVFLLDSSTRRVRFTLQARGNVATALAFSPDGGTLVTASRDLTIKLWDPATGRMRATLGGNSSHIFALAFAADGTTLASAHVDSRVRVWDVASRRRRGALECPPHPAFAVAFAPDGKTIATGHNDGIIVLWDADTLRERARLRESGAAVRALAFSPDARTLASGGSDSVVRLWDLTHRTRDSRTSGAP